MTTFANSAAHIDLAAFADNIRTLRGRTSSELMIAVKANAYGHGLVPCARTALEAGAEWLGTARPDEALTLRKAGIGGRILAWLWTPGAPFVEAVAAEIDISVSGWWDLKSVVDAGRHIGRPGRVHLKVDTGLGRNGITSTEWPRFVRAARAAEQSGAIEVVGIWSHLASADVPEDPSVATQIQAFRHAVTQAEHAGLRGRIRHLANSAATLLLPETHFDMVRIGMAAYGLSPVPERLPAEAVGLRPVMTLATHLSSVKWLPAGHGVSYGHEYRTSAAGNVALVPIGFADGVPRTAGNVARVLAAGKQRRIVGRVSMDQFVIELNNDTADVGDQVVLFGPGTRGEPTVDDWAVALRTISTEIVTRIGPAVARIHHGNGKGRVERCLASAEGGNC